MSNAVSNNMFFLDLEVLEMTDGGCAIEKVQFMSSKSQCSLF